MTKEGEQEQDIVADHSTDFDETEKRKHDMDEAAIANFENENDNITKTHNNEQLRIEPEVNELSTEPHPIPCRIPNCENIQIPNNSGFCKLHTNWGICLHSNCDSFIPNAAEQIFCSLHLQIKRCKIEGCNKVAVSGKGGETGCCIRHGGGRRCRYDGCIKSSQGATLFCIQHGGGRRCQMEGCTKATQGKTKFCITHGGGSKCKHEQCDRFSVGKGFCMRHGGGSKCKFEGCKRNAAKAGKVGFCTKHGGGARCTVENCNNLAGKGGKKGLCITHGGGRRCGHNGCTKAAVRGGLPGLCLSHGGGKRCTEDGCNSAASRRGEKADKCIRHGGGNRCQFQFCTNSTPSSKGYCATHGGGLRCKHDGCSKPAAHFGNTKFCITHGGGSRCKVDDCSNVIQHGTDYCVSHGGGRRCKIVDCNRVVSQDGHCYNHNRKQCRFEGCHKYIPKRSVDDMCRVHQSSAGVTHNNMQSDEKEVELEEINDLKEIEEEMDEYPTSI